MTPDRRFDILARLYDGDGLVYERHRSGGPATEEPPPADALMVSMEEIHELRQAGLCGWVGPCSGKLYGNDQGLKRWLAGEAA
jgi:hypothetical protein